MALTVRFFDPAGCEISQMTGKGDAVVGRLFSEFLVEELRDRGWQIRAEVTANETDSSSYLPNMRIAAEQLAQILKQRQPVSES